MPTLFIFFFNTAILVRIEWYFITFLICISLMAGDIEHIFMCFEAMCISSLEKGLFRSFVHLFVFLLLSYMCSLYILDTRPLSNTICKIFLPFLGEIFFYFPFLDQDFGLFLKKCIYLFIWIQWVLVEAHGIVNLYCGMRDLFSFLSCGIWDLVPWPGVEPWSPALEPWSLSHWSTREIPRLWS